MKSLWLIALSCSLSFSAHATLSPAQMDTINTYIKQGGNGGATAAVKAAFVARLSTLEKQMTVTSVSLNASAPTLQQRLGQVQTAVKNYSDARLNVYSDKTWRTQFISEAERYCCAERNMTETLSELTKIQQQREIKQAKKQQKGLKNDGGDGGQTKEERKARKAEAAEQRRADKPNRKNSAPADGASDGEGGGAAGDSAAPATDPDSGGRGGNGGGGGGRKRGNNGG